MPDSPAPTASGTAVWQHHRLCNHDLYAMYWDIGRYAHLLSYSFRLPVRFDTLHVSVNVLAVSHGFDMATFSPSSAWLLDYLTLIDVMRPDISTYQVRIPVVQGSELTVHEAADGMIALHMTPVVSIE